MSARSYVRTSLMAPGRERRLPENDTLRRLLQVGRMLALHARQPGLNLGARNLADSWDKLVAELHEGRPAPAAPRVASEVPLGAEADAQHVCASHADSDGTGYCRGCGVTVGEPHHPCCDRARPEGKP